MSRVARWRQGMGGPSQPEYPDLPKRPRPEHYPSPADVVVARAMLCKGLRLPRELVDSIIDQSEYWPRSVTEIDYKKEHGQEKQLIGKTSEDMLLVRCPPVGLYHELPSQSLGYSHHEVRPEEMGDEVPKEYFEKLVKGPEVTLEHPVRMIIFSISSRDQGWVTSDPNRTKGTFDESWTWFEAGLERFSAPLECPEHCPYDIRPKDSPPELPICCLRSLYPQVERPDEGDPKLKHALLQNEKYTVQCNRRAVRHVANHEVVWSYLDNDDPESPEAREKLRQVGRGAETGSGEFVRSLKLGDVVSLWGKARFGAWSNHIEKVKVEIYWAV